MCIRDRRYDDTNPTKEDVEFVDSIYEDLKWLIGEDPDGVFYGSDYFDKCYEYAVKLIKDGKACLLYTSVTQGHFNAARGRISFKDALKLLYFNTARA